MATPLIEMQENVRETDGEDEDDDYENDKDFAEPE